MDPSELSSCAVYEGQSICFVLRGIRPVVLELQAIYSCGRHGCRFFGISESPRESEKRLGGILGPGKWSLLAVI
eukprot:scaffold9618_cov41-Cyclotella_meneghiniana.AAC.6